MNQLTAPEPGYTGFVEEEHHHDYAGDTLLGFWIYIMSDCILFATLFATYAVLSFSFAGGLTPKDLFDLNFVAVETGLLLFSSFTFGMAMLGAQNKNMAHLLLWLGITFSLGGGFLAMELYEFYHFSHEGAGPTTSAYWSAFYALVGTHGLHVFAGMLWMVFLVIHMLKDGITETNFTRLSCLSLFWHFLDIIWICVFSMVYLMGVM
ncbi:cytochrome o ubiquinol oxidase subunit III [Arenicella sp. 4NH20-0111]|uniref:cytochrome o ubiquinol oxidase subunit III n=1 Tax=Arenicella sp. 4NH20-0111 TaxID=3127648 RepID=UPI003109DF74